MADRQAGRQTRVPHDRQSLCAGAAVIVVRPSCFSVFFFSSIGALLRESHRKRSNLVTNLDSAKKQAGRIGYSWWVLIAEVTPRDGFWFMSFWCCCGIYGNEILS